MIQNLSPPDEPTLTKRQITEQGLTLKENEHRRGKVRAIRLQTHAQPHSFMIYSRTAKPTLKKRR
jgi:hypothetical protein